MQFRDHPAVAGKRDSYPVDPRALKVDPTYNVRDMADPETIAHVRWLADSIKENGVKTPLEWRRYLRRRRSLPARGYDARHLGRR